MVLLKLLWLMLCAFMLASFFSHSVSAVNELTMFTTRLNWFDGNDTDSILAHNRTLLVSWRGGVPGGTGLFLDVSLNLLNANNFNFTIANNCGFGSSIANCTCNSTLQKANCTIFGNGTFPFGVTWNGTGGPLAASELSLSVTGSNATNGTSTLAHNAANLSWLRIPESKLFHTLIEFGRGRGNYFFDSAGRENSAGVGTGQPYLPNGSRVELNYLHKVFNVRQYFGLATEKAENATWRCLYPNSSVVRNHFTETIRRSAGVFNATFRIPEIEGSFERQGYIGQQFETDETVFGFSKIVNCTNFAYTLGNASGNISVEVDDFNLTVRDREPINFTASTGTTVIGNGTQEVIINYTFHNKEIFPVTDVIVEIGAPLHSKFVGTRLELWGVGLNKYRFERAFIPSRGNETIELVARFNTTNADAGLTLLNLSGTSRISVVNPWDQNAYNPSETIYNFQDRHTVTVDLAISSRIDPLSDLNQITRNLTNITLRLNESLFAMNSSLRDVLQGINQSMQIINQTLVDRLVGINLSLQTINQTLVDRLAAINVSLQQINESLFDFLVSFNRTIFSQLQNLTNITIEVNRTIQTISTNISQIRVRIDRIEEFENELVFLVTDSFGMQQAAVEQIRSGDIGGAVQSMKQANDDLNQLADRIASERAIALSAAPTGTGQATAETAAEFSGRHQSSSTSGLSWLTIINLSAITLILLMIIHHVYVTRKRDEF